MQRGIEVNYSIEDGLSIAIVIPYKDADKGLLAEFWNELESKPLVMQRIKMRGASTFEDILKEYLICYYGGADTRTDISNNITKTDYCHCGNRGNCPDEGFEGLCSPSPVIGDIKLNRTEIELMSLVANDKSVKEIANLRHRSIHTVESQVKSIRAKLSSKSVAAAIYKTTAAGITL